MAIASAIYDTYASAAAAVENVKAAGVPEQDISIVSNDATTDRTGYDTYRPDGPRAENEAAAGAGVGAAAGGAAGLLAGIGLLAIPGLGPVVAAGWLASTAVAAGAAGVAGGLIGSMVSSGVGEEEAHAYAEGLRRGGTVVSVRVSEENHGRIQNILDADAYPLNRRAADWRKEGWTGRYDQADFR